MTIETLMSSILEQASMLTLIGFLGPVIFTYAYTMVSLNYWSGDQLRTHVWNFIGALAILISLIEQWNLPVFVLEICWSAISIYGIWRVIKTRRMATKQR